MDRKLIVNGICMGLFLFMNAMEYAIILPSINGYLLSLGASQDFLGFALSAYSLSGVLFSPLFGYITDKTRAIRLIIIAANAFEILGNFLYLTVANANVILLARLKAGIGGGAKSTVYDIISRLTSHEDRTSFFSILLLFRHIGYISGPIINIFLTTVDFNIGPLQVNQFNAPALVTTSAYVLHLLLMVIAYSETRESLRSENDFKLERESETNNTCDVKAMLARQVEAGKREFLREEVIVCLGATFFTAFVARATDTATPPGTLLLFHWGDLQNSYVYIVSSVCAIIGFCALKFLSKKFSDRILLSVGCVILTIGNFLFIFLTCIAYVNRYDMSMMLTKVLFITATVVYSLCMAFFQVPPASLFSKITSYKSQGFCQGMRVAFSALGEILGPLWGASMSTVDRFPFLFGVNAFLICILLVMTVLSYRRLIPEERSGMNGYEVSCDWEDSEEETSSLLFSLQRTRVDVDKPIT